MSAAIVNHVGVTTPDIFGTIDWYGSVFGFKLIMGPRVLEPEGASPETRQIYGARFHKAYQAHLLSANGVGIELFEFVEPPVEPAEDEYHYDRPGFSHLCLTVPDVAAGVDRLVAAGGVKMSEPSHFVPGRPWQLSYCRDPWGTVIELVSASYTEMFANWPQPGMTARTRILRRDGTEAELA